MVVADFNLDGHSDVAVAAGNGISLSMGIGDGTLSNDVIWPLSASASSIAVADFNNDGIPDIAARQDDAETEIEVLLGFGDGTFLIIDDRPSSPYPTRFDTADFNNDRFDDIVVSPPMTTLTCIWGTVTVRF